MKKTVPNLQRAVTNLNGTRPWEASMKTWPKNSWSAPEQTWQLGNPRDSCRCFVPPFFKGTCAVDPQQHLTFPSWRPCVGMGLDGWWGWGGWWWWRRLWCIVGHIKKAMCTYCILLWRRKWRLVCPLPRQRFRRARRIQVTCPVSRGEDG